MTTSGVPDDDMPESLLPLLGGSQSFDDQDLDALLAGNTSDVPQALRPVADALNALGTAPAPGELRGEAAIRAQFRALGPDAATPATPVPGHPGRHAAGQKPARAAQAHTLRLPGLTGPGRHGRRGPSPARPGRARPGGVRPLAMVAGAGALAVIAAAAAYMGVLPAPMQRIAHVAIAAPSPRSDGGASATPGTDIKSASPVPATSGHPAAAPSAPPSDSPSAKRRNDSCEAFWQALEHQSPGDEPWKSPIYNQLSGDAGGPRNVYRYCYQVWTEASPRAGRFPSEYAKLPSYPPYFPHPGGSGSTGVHDQGNGSTGSDGNRRNGNSQNGKGQNGSGQGGPGDSGDSGRPGTGPGAMPKTPAAPSIATPSAALSASAGATAMATDSNS